MTYESQHTVEFDMCLQALQEKTMQSDENRPNDEDCRLSSFKKMKNKQRLENGTMISFN
jgi:hypothetical protein